MSLTPFTHQLPINNKKFKIALLSLVITFILCVLAVIVSNYFWDDYTKVVYSYKYQSNVTVGWPASLSGWSRYLGIAIIVLLPMMYFMQDFKNPSLALSSDSLFINQQLMRNTWILFSNIQSIKKEEQGKYLIFIKDPEPIIKQQIFLFKPFVKSNLGQKQISISEMYSAGNLEELMTELGKKLQP